METMNVRRTPQQERAENTVSSILLAAEKLLSQEAQTSFTTNHIAEVAGVSIGSLYQYFPNKEAILAKLVEEMLGESRRVLLDTLRTIPISAPLEIFVQELIGSLARVFTQQGQTRRILLEQLPLLGKFKSLQELKHEVQTVIKEELLRRYEDLNKNQIDECVFIMVQSVETVLNTCVYLEFNSQKMHDVLSELNKMIFTYLKVR